MIGYIRILKNQVINESKINRHIMVSDKEDYSYDNVDPFIVSSKIKGIRRSSWALIIILAASACIYLAQPFWVAKVMTTLVMLIVLIGLYVNAHNLINHKRWLTGDPLLNGKQFLSAFTRKPIITLIGAFTKTGDTREYH